MKNLNRRSLLKSSSAALAALSIPKTLQALPASNHAGMHFGLVTYLWGQHMTLDDLLDNCEQAGLQGVELRTEAGRGFEQAGGETVHDVEKPAPDDDPGSQLQVAELRRHD